MMASSLILPLILVIENNHYAYSTPVETQSHNPKFSDRAIGYGIPGVTVDGTDIEAVYEATLKAVEHAREGRGPSIIETVTMRMRGHAEHDAFEYVPKELLAEWEAKDPVRRTAELICKPAYRQRREARSSLMQSPRSKKRSCTQIHYHLLTRSKH